MPRAKSGRFVKKSELERVKKVASQAKVLVKCAQEKKAARQAEREPVHNIGRRVVDLAVLANNMWCADCEIPLSFRWIEKEVQRGLASIFHVRCGTCLKVICVPTSTSFKLPDNTGYPLYSVNCKAAAGTFTYC